jgi:hypothetical protein
LKFSRSLSGKHFVSKAGKRYFAQWDHDKKHREVVTRKFEKIQGLVALLDTWEAQPENTVEEISQQPASETAQRPDAVQSNGNMNKYGFSAEEIKASNAQLMKHMLASLPGESPMQHSREDG